MSFDPVRLGPDQILPILQVRARDLSPRVLVAGDPARVTRMAALLDDAERVGSSREYLTYTGTHRGTRVSVVSHGVGAAGAAIAFEELCRGGASHIIRVGTAGGLDPSIAAGAVVVATAAVRADGVTPRLIPSEYPAVADAWLVAALQRALHEQRLDPVAGIVLTEGNFYPSPVLPKDLAMWRDAGAVAVEMEVAALLTIASLNRVRAAAVLAIDGNPLAAGDEKMLGYDPSRDTVEKAVVAAINAGLQALEAV